ncbi:MAG TPA: hypothetical protein VGR02_20440 [Thermoanaerobaculia bacterium]|jgi:hypothetical protein|nr:hypothetical protein [Thermoanaerobaculia bacterium]
MAKRSNPEIVVFELEQYINAYRSSSDRTRYVIFIVTIVTLLIATAEWNFLRLSWSRQKHDQAIDAMRARFTDQWLESRRQNRSESPYASSLEPQLSGSKRTSAERWTPVDRWVANEAALHELTHQETQFEEHTRFVPVPVVGASIHINDLGLVAGVVLFFILALLAACMAREHENLYLAMFKVRRLAVAPSASEVFGSKPDDDPPADHGESAANLLYHALAMVQVLSDPPTLARWNPNRFAGGALSLIYFLPTAVMYGVVFQNIASHEKALEVWDPWVMVARISFQIAFCFGLLFLSAICAGYQLKSTRLWIQTFFSINPGLRHVEQRPWREWVGLDYGLVDVGEKERRTRELMHALTYSLRVERNMSSPAISCTDWHLHDSKSCPPPATVPWWKWAKVPRPRYEVTQSILRAAACRLSDGLLTEAGKQHDEDSIAGFRDIKVTSNTMSLSAGNIVEWKATANAACGLKGVKCEPTPPA